VSPGDALPVPSGAELDAVVDRRGLDPHLGTPPSCNSTPASVIG
jgi:hypothetical protein